MKDIFKTETANYFKTRIEKLSTDSQSKWGKMNVSQMLSHCIKATNMASGELKTKRMFIGKIIGKLILNKVIKDATPFVKNSPTAKELIANDSTFKTEQVNLINCILEISKKEEKELDGIVHPFFGKMEGKQWNVLVYKHLDHHLNQFGV